MINLASESHHRLLVIIPVYNHHQKISALLEKINGYGLPCLLLDDGSNEVTRITLEKSVFANTPDRDALIKNMLRRFDSNRGKGAVVCDGILYAEQQGYSHVLQVDADGQHDLDDLPRFLAESRQHPEAIINGCRSYSAMPRGRRYGRMVTDFWVTIHTLSRDIADSMCGYRLYPVSVSAALARTQTIGSRMDFDTDMIVRLYWQGLQVRPLYTAILYSDSIDSHFDLWADNLRITKMHTRLFFGMLPRIPQLLLRKFYSPAPNRKKLS